MNTRKDISAKDRAFLEGLFAGKEITQAAIDAGYADAARIGQEKIKDPAFRAAYVQELENRRWDAEAICGKIAEFLRATKRLYIGPGGVLYEDEKEKEAREAQARFIDTTLDVLGF